MAMGSAMPKLAGMGLTRIWLRVGGAGWLTWKGLAWAAEAGAGAGAEPPEQRKEINDMELTEYQYSIQYKLSWALQ